MRTIFLLFVLVSSFSHAQLITTYAGGGSSGGSGIPATSAFLNNPAGSTFDKLGNLYFAEVSGNVIRKVSGDGIITTIAGTGVAGYNGDGIQATAAQLYNPSGVTVDINGSIYIADCGNYRIRKIDAITKTISTIAGVGISGFSGDGGPATLARISVPYDLCVDISGNIFFTDNGNYRVRKVDISGIITTHAGNGSLGDSGDGGPATAAQFTSIYGIQVTGDGTILVADWTGGKIRKISASGTISTIVGTGVHVFNGDDIAATTANVSPIRFAMNKSGEIYIADYANYRIRKVATSGKIFTVAGTGINGYAGDGGAASGAQLGGINGVSLDTCGNLYVSAHFARIRKIAFNPDCLPISVKDVKSREAVSVTLHPNPATETLTITAGVEIVSVSVMNAIGQSFDVAHDDRLRTGGSGERQLPIDVTHLPTGVYMVRVNEVWVGKFVKE